MSTEDDRKIRYECHANKKSYRNRTRNEIKSSLIPK